MIEVWRRHLTAEPGAAVRVLARAEAGSPGPEEYAVGVTTKPDAQLYPEGDTGELFTGLSFAEAHWVAAVLASVAETVEDAENLLFDLRVPVELTWRDIELACEVIEPGGLRSSPLVPWSPSGEDGGDEPSYTVATYTFECGHQAVELLRQDPESAPFWVLEGAVDHLAARDARSLSRLLMASVTLDEAHDLIEQAQENLATHANGDHDDEDDEDDDHERDHDHDD